MDSFASVMEKKCGGAHPPTCENDYISWLKGKIIENPWTTPVNIDIFYHSGSWLQTTQTILLLLYSLDQREL